MDNGNANSHRGFEEDNEFSPSRVEEINLEESDKGREAESYDRASAHLKHIGEAAVRNPEALTPSEEPQLGEIVSQDQPYASGDYSSNTPESPQSEPNLGRPLNAKEVDNLIRDFERLPLEDAYAKARESSMQSAEEVRKGAS